MSLKKPFVPKSDVKQRFITTTTPLWRQRCGHIALPLSAQSYNLRLQWLSQFRRHSPTIDQCWLVGLFIFITARVITTLHVDIEINPFIPLANAG